MSESIHSKAEGHFHIVLFQPVIPQNTGSVARLCACTGSVLHLIHPLGFQTDQKAVRRAGLDYWPHVDIREHLNWEAFLEAEKPSNLNFFSKFAGPTYTEAKLTPPSYLVFGSETTGLPDAIWEKNTEKFFQIPMRRNLVRSLNLAQAVAIVQYEGLRQEGFPDLDHPAPSRLGEPTSHDH